MSSYGNNNNDNSWKTLNSMRNVDPESEIYLKW